MVSQLRFTLAISLLLSLILHTTSIARTSINTPLETITIRVNEGTELGSTFLRTGGPSCLTCWVSYGWFQRKVVGLNRLRLRRFVHLPGGKFVNKNCSLKHSVV